MSGGDDASRLMMSPARQQLLDEVQELDGVSLKQANAIASELCTNIQFTSQLLIDHEGIDSADSTLDHLLETNEVRLKVCCVAGLRSISSQADLESVKASYLKRQKLQALERKYGSSQSVIKSFNLPLPPGGGGVEGTEPPLTPSSPNAAGGQGFGEELDIKVVLDQLLFEVEAEDFGDILAELKATHTSLRALLGGVNNSADTDGNGEGGGGGGNGGGTSSMIRSVFDAVDTDGSGLIDKYELQACIEKFNVAHDPKFFKYVLREEGIREDDELDFERFERFLIRFLQHQFYKKIESYVSNKSSILSLGGRAVSYSHRGTIVENTSRKSMAAIGMSGSTSFADEPSSSSFDGTREGQGNEANKEDEEDEEDDEEDEEEKERLARQKKLGREAKAARVRQRMKQNAVVTNLITTLKGDLQKGMAELDELTSETAGGEKSKGKQGADKDKKSGGGGGSSKGGKLAGGSKDSSVAAKGAGKFPVKLSVRRKKKKSEKDVYGMLADKIKKAIKDLEQQHKSTVMVSKERDQLEDYLTRMLAERDVTQVPPGQGGRGGAGAPSSLPPPRGGGNAGGGKYGAGFMGRSGTAMEL
mmetsp:Transcript_43398/g.80320  ORF Transcript_43398/g.80320 Transcript_43398/m.80320 type:complete len:589 (+) Transcript_43398:1238-3004(+)